MNYWDADPLTFARHLESGTMLCDAETAWIARQVERRDAAVRAAALVEVVALRRHCAELRALLREADDGGLLTLAWRRRVVEALKKDL